LDPADDVAECRVALVVLGRRGLERLAAVRRAVAALEALAEGGRRDRLVADAVALPPRGGVARRRLAGTGAASLGARAEQGRDDEGEHGDDGADDEHARADEPGPDHLARRRRGDLGGGGRRG